MKSIPQYFSLSNTKQQSFFKQMIDMVSSNNTFANNSMIFKTIDSSVDKYRKQKRTTIYDSSLEVVKLV